MRWNPRMFPSRVTATRQSSAAGNLGPGGAGPVTLGTDLPCSIQPTDPADPGMATAFQAGYDTLVLFPADPGLKADDTLRDAKSGRSWRVKGVVNQADADLLWQCRCQSVSTR